jgi:hypothetical protein
VTICDRAVDDLAAVEEANGTILSGIAPLMPGRTCVLEVTSGNESDTATVAVLDPWLTDGHEPPLQLTVDVNWVFAQTFTQVAAGYEVFCTNAADPAAVCGTYHADHPVALALWLPEAMVGGQNDELLLQIARSLY